MQKLLKTVSVISLVLNIFLIIPKVPLIEEISIETDTEGPCNEEEVLAYTFTGEIYSFFFASSSLKIGVDGIPIYLTMPNGNIRHLFTYEGGYFEFLNVPIMAGTYQLTIMIPHNIYFMSGSVRTSLGDGIPDSLVTTIIPGGHQLTPIITNANGEYRIFNQDPQNLHFLVIPPGAYHINITPSLE